MSKPTEFRQVETAFKFYYEEKKGLTPEESYLKSLQEGKVRVTTNQDSAGRLLDSPVTTTVTHRIERGTAQNAAATLPHKNRRTLNIAEKIGLITIGGVAVGVAVVGGAYLNRERCG